MAEDAREQMAFTGTRVSCEELVELVEVFCGVSLGKTHLAVPFPPVRRYQLHVHRFVDGFCSPYENRCAFDMTDDIYEKNINLIVCP